MAYTAKTWNAGDLVTAADMNKIEDGIYRNIIKIDTGTISSLPYTYTNSKIKANMQVISYGYTSTDMFAGPVLLTCYDGYLTITSNTMNNHIGKLIKSGVLHLLLGEVNIFENSAATSSGVSSLVAKSTSGNITLVTPDFLGSSTSFSAQKEIGIGIRDYNDDLLGLVKSTASTDGKISMELTANRTISNTAYSNSIKAKIDSSGNCTYEISDKAAFRDAIYAAATIEIVDASWSNVHSNLSSLTINEVSTVYMSSAAMKLISGNAIQTKFIGIVQRFDTSNYDFFGCGDVYGNNTEAYVFRLTGVNTSGGTFAQAKKITLSTSV